MTRQRARGLLTEHEAVAGRAAGRSQRAIAADLGLNPSAVSRALKRAHRRLAREIPTELAAVLRREHVALEQVRVEAWAKWAASRDLAALDRVLRASEQIADLWGLGRRAKVDVKLRREPSPAELLSDADLLAAAEVELAEARARLALRPAAVPINGDQPERFSATADGLAVGTPDTASGCSA